MATLLNETRGPGFFIAHEANGTISRETIVVDTGALAVGTILGKITASGKYVQVAPAAVDGSEVAAGILYDAVDATAGDVEAVAIVRHAEVNKDELVYPTGATQPQIDAIDAQLLALQIKTLV